MNLIRSCILFYIIYQVYDTVHNQHNDLMILTLLTESGDINKALQLSKSGFSKIPKNIVTLDILQLINILVLIYSFSFFHQNIIVKKIH